MPAENTREIAAALLRKAEADYEAMVAMRGRGPKLAPVIGFHAQQAMEKAVKAVMVLNGLRLKRTHDIAALLYDLKDAHIEVPTIKIAPEALTRFAVEGRYFEVLEEPDVRSVNDALFSDIEGVLAWAESSLSK
jgi:HEPN domain-containing protein